MEEPLYYPSFSSLMGTMPPSLAILTVSEPLPIAFLLLQHSRHAADFSSFNSELRLHCLETELLNLSAGDIQEQRMQCCACCPVYHSMCNSILGLHPPNSMSTTLPSVMTTSDIPKCPLGEQIHPS